MLTSWCSGAQAARGDRPLRMHVCARVSALGPRLLPRSSAVVQRMIPRGVAQLAGASIVQSEGASSTPSHWRSRCRKRRAEACTLPSLYSTSKTGNCRIWGCAADVPQATRSAIERRNSLSKCITRVSHHGLGPADADPDARSPANRRVGLPASARHHLPAAQVREERAPGQCAAGSWRRGRRGGRSDPLAGRCG